MEAKKRLKELEEEYFKVAFGKAHTKLKNMLLAESLKEEIENTIRIIALQKKREKREKDKQLLINIL